MEVFVIMLSGFFLFILEGLVYKKIWDKGLSAEIGLTRKNAFPGDKCRLTIRIENRKTIPLPWLWIKFNVSSSFKFQKKQQIIDNYIYYNALFCINGWERIDRELEFTPTKRGYYPIKKYSLIGSSILFNGKHIKDMYGNANLTVYPKLADMDDILSVISKTDGTFPTKGFYDPDPFEFAGIKEYTVTDSFKDINFNATARMGQLMTNRHDPTVSGEVTIILCFSDLSKKNSYVNERNEYAVSIAATLAQYYSEKGYSLELLTNGKDGQFGTSVNLSSATGELMLSNIFEALARLDYNEPGDISEIDSYSYTNGNVIFISLSAQKSVCGFFEKIKSRYASALWLIPMMEFDIATTELPNDYVKFIPVKQ